MKFWLLALAAAVAAPRARAVSAGEGRSSLSGALAPNLGKGLRFATLKSGGAYPSGDTDVTLREGLGENLPFPGSDYLGMGYNAVYGNPDGDGEKMEDPGWRGPVIRIPWCQDAACLSSDMLNLRPTDKDGNPVGWAHREVACEMSKNVVSMKHMSDYSRSLEVDASVDVEVGGGLFGVGAAFSASVGYGTFKREVAEGSSTRYQLKSYCTHFTMGLYKRNYYGEGIRDQIFTKVRGRCGNPADSEEELKKWFYLFDTFGTHVATEVTLGGKMVMTSTVEDSSTATTSTSDVAAAVSASFDGAVFGGSGSLSTKASKSAMDSFKSSNKRSHVSLFGGLPPADNPVGSAQGFGEWAATVAERPMPVKYKLCRLDECAGVPKDHYEYAVKKYAESAKAAEFDNGFGNPAKVDLPKALPSPRRQWKGGDRLFCGERMYPGEFLFSKNGKYRAGFDTTFNFMVQEVNHDGIWVAKWQARTGTESSGSGVDKMTWNCAGHAPLYAVLGNFCRLDIWSEDEKIWSSVRGSNVVHACEQNNTGGMVLGNDGKLYIVTYWGKGVWRSGDSMSENQARGHYWHDDKGVENKRLQGSLTTDRCATFDDKSSYSYEGPENPTEC